MLALIATFTPNPPHYVAARAPQPLYSLPVLNLSQRDKHIA